MHPRRITYSRDGHVKSPPHLHATIYIGFPLLYSPVYSAVIASLVDSLGDLLEFRQRSYEVGGSWEESWGDY